MEYPGYPTERFTSTESVDIPSGSWEMNGEPLPDPTLTEHLKQKGYEIDTQGRPLHPNVRTMLSQGALSGRGAYWNWGPNYTVDPIVVTEEEVPRVLLIQRADTKKWALPGGFVDSGEDSHNAALRELQEETGIQPTRQGTLVYEGVVEDPRTTAHAWAETSAYVFRLSEAMPAIAADDALKAEWYTFADIYKHAEADMLHGSHLQLIIYTISALSEERRSKPIPL